MTIYTDAIQRLIQEEDKNWEGLSKVIHDPEDFEINEKIQIYEEYVAHLT